LIPLIVGQLGAAATAVGSARPGYTIARPHGAGNLRCSPQRRDGVANYALAAAIGKRPAAGEAVDLVEPWLESATRYDCAPSRCGCCTCLACEGRSRRPGGRGSAAVALDRLARTLEAAPIAQGQLALAEHWAKAGKSTAPAKPPMRRISIYQRLGCDALAKKAPSDAPDQVRNAV